MAILDAEQVTKDLNGRFAAPLKDFYQRRIIFWKDEEQEFIDKFDELSLENAKLIKLTETNNFAVKKLLTVDDTTSNYLVYCPVRYSDEENWLLPIELYSEEFRADLISIWISEMGIADSMGIRNLVRGYKKFFNTKAHRTKISNLSQSITSPAQLHLGVMAVLCGLKDFQPNAILQAVFKSYIADDNGLYESFERFDVKTAFWAMVAQGSGYRADEPELDQLIAHVLLTAATRTLSIEWLEGLDVFISMPHQAYCYNFIAEWINSNDNSHLYDLSRLVEAELSLSRRFAKTPVEALVDCEIFPCIDECILTQLMNDITHQIIDVEKIRKVVEKRRTYNWYSLVRPYYEGLQQVANMQEFMLDHGAGFHTVEAYKVWQQYTDDYYKMDTYYRQFHCHFSECLKNTNEILEDDFKNLAEQVEGLYENWYLRGLSENWSTAAAEELAQYGRILEVPQQVDFYRDKVANAENNIYVIISDALRYEVATSLTEQLRRETQAEVKLNSCSAIFPTVTKFGMAALLPHKELTVVEKSNGLAVYADGKSTDASYRDSVLKDTNADSIAVKYKDLVLLKREERRSLVKGKKVVYIYHDKIDETSHTNESLVFPACEEAIDEIKNIIRIIVNDFGGANIIVTADHGFLYTYTPLSEDSKVDKTTASTDDVEVDRRYLITRKGAKPDYLMSVNFAVGADEYDAFSPRESIRIKKKGGGLNFVHGGVSLQEMVVPVVEYHYLRNQSKAYQKNKQKYDTKPVPLNLLSASRKVSNMIFSLDFHQGEAVSDNREPANYLIYFEDAERNQVSDIQKIIADKTSDNAPDRKFRCTFNLKPLKFSNSELYYLVIADESGIQAPQREEFTIDIAFAVDEFDFFS